MASASQDSTLTNHPKYDGATPNSTPGAGPSDEERIKELEVLVKRYRRLAEDLCEKLVLLKKELECRPLINELPVQQREVPKPEIFQGIQDTKTVESFIEDIERYFEAAHIPDAKVTLAGMYLIGDAKMWWRDRWDERRTRPRQGRFPKGKSAGARWSRGAPKKWQIVGTVQDQKCPRVGCSANASKGSVQEAHVATASCAERRRRQQQLEAQDMRGEECPRVVCSSNAYKANVQETHSVAEESKHASETWDELWQQFGKKFRAFLDHSTRSSSFSSGGGL